MNILYISHGGGPLPLLGDKSHAEMVDSLRRFSGQLSKPSAIVVVSAHWEEPVFTILHASAPDLIYDYYGFPDEAYHIKYPAAGSPDLADKIFQLISRHNIDCRLDETRGFDHGLYVPLKIMYPEADIPCIQVSLNANLDPRAHIEMGKSLSALKSENILVIGSGFSFHNMKAFFANGEETDKRNIEFEDWLQETCTNISLNETEREKRLINWEQAPHARYCHPREEHLLPLQVCYGIAQGPCSEHHFVDVINKRSSFCLWQAGFNA